MSIEELERKLDDIIKKINDRINNLSDDDSFSDIGDAFVKELNEVKKSLLKLLPKSKRICEGLENLEKYKRIWEQIFEIEKLGDILGLDLVSTLSEIKDSAFPSIILNWKAKWKWDIPDAIYSYFNIIAKDVKLELLEFPPKNNILTARTTKALKFEFVKAETVFYDPIFAQAYNTETILPLFEIHVQIECNLGNPRVIKDLSLRLIYLEPRGVLRRVTEPKHDLYYWMGFLAPHYDLIGHPQNLFFVYDNWKLTNTDTFAVKYFKNSSEEWGNFDETIELSYKSN